MMPRQPLIVGAGSRIELDRARKQRKNRSVTTPRPWTCRKLLVVLSHRVTEEPGHKAKACRICGKDLTGKPRQKDDKGYLCGACADAENKRESELEKCPECSRRLSPSAFTTFRGKRICRRCMQAHEEAGRPKVVKIDTEHHDTHEKQKIILLAVILVAIVVVILLQTLVF